MEMGNSCAMKTPTVTWASSLLIQKAFACHQLPQPRTVVHLEISPAIMGAFVRQDSRSGLVSVLHLFHSHAASAASLSAWGVPNSATNCCRHHSLAWSVLIAQEVRSSRAVYLPHQRA